MAGALERVLAERMRRGKSRGGVVLCHAAGKTSPLPPGQKHRLTPVQEKIDQAQRNVTMVQ